MASSMSFMPMPGVLGVEPEGVELAVLADDLDQLRAEQLADARRPGRT